eukprot:m.1182674 g.1182674  ORF g.1182674 m.1182674 type:complete len:60 (+) comp24538_c0_seq2:2682-2861(+)
MAMYYWHIIHDHNTQLSVAALAFLDLRPKKKKSSPSEVNDLLIEVVLVSEHKVTFVSPL